MELVKLITHTGERIEGKVDGPRKIVFSVPGGTTIVAMDIPATEWTPPGPAPLPDGRPETFIGDGVYVLTFEDTLPIGGMPEPGGEFERYGRFRNPMDRDSISRRFRHSKLLYDLAVEAAGHQSAFTVDKLATRLRNVLPELIEMWAREIETTNRIEMED